ncbi:MAG: DUF2802 domain-containing protein [Kangiellaceae bacterium]|nr:DUF2802 domain-containing protein [Kangiellaceae bacterium]
MSQWLSASGLSNGYLLIVLGTYSIIAVIGFFYLFKKNRFLAHQLSQIQNEIRAINSGNLGMGRKLNRFAEDIANVESGQGSAHEPVVEEKTYQQAGLLLSRGATIEEVVECCGMSPAEVELVAIMRHSGTAA